MKDFKTEILRRRPVALYQSISSDYFFVDEVKYATHDERYEPLPEGEKRERVSKDYVRISEPVEIGFEALTDDSIVQKAVAALDEAERVAINELNAKIASIRQQKASLLALTHTPEAV